MMSTFSIVAHIFFKSNMLGIRGKFGLLVKMWYNAEDIILI
jgi:hypothetical protein